MPTHSAKSLFDSNIASADHCITLYDGIVGLQTKLDLSWLLRAAVVFSVSALDAFFHDKVKYRAGRFKIAQLPPELVDFPIELNDINSWAKYTSRPGNFIRNMVSRHYSTRPLQKKRDIEQALSLVGIKSLWNTIEPNNTSRTAMLKRLSALIQRRNQIAHEGDRWQSRKSGKSIRPIDRPYAVAEIAFVKDVVAKIESAFPK